MAKTPVAASIRLRGAQSGAQSSRRRWAVGIMLFLAAVLNYVDRSILGIVAPSIQKDLGISDAQYGRVVDVFLVAYTLAYLFSGRVVDRIGSRLSMGVFVGFWSIANALTAAATSLVSLGCFRFLLGLGEAGGYTGSPKAVSEWFAPKERAFAVGLYSIGGSVGATLTPLLVVSTAGRYGWRGAFVVTGAAGLAWVLPWLWVSRPFRAPLGFDAPDGTPASAVPMDDTSEWQRWKSILVRPEVWQLMGGRLLTDAVWYFYLFWMPKYLHTARGVPQEGMGVMVYVFLAADVGFLSGGLLSDRLVRRGVSPPASRLWLMGLAACLVPTSALVPGVRTVPMVIACAAVMTFAHCTWLGNITALVVDIVPRSRLATTFGVICAGSAAGGIAMNALVTSAITHGSYDVVFYVMACLHPVALLMLWPLRKQPVADPAEE